MRLQIGLHQGMEQDDRLGRALREQRSDSADMVDVKMGGGDDSDRHERALYGVGAEFLNGVRGANAAAIDNHQAVFLVCDQVSLGKATARNWMHHACLHKKLRRIVAGFVCAPTTYLFPGFPLSRE